MVASGAGGLGVSTMAITRAYALDDLRLRAIERYVVDALRDGDPTRVMACAVIDGGSSLAAYGRSMERLQFPKYDMAAAMAPYERLSTFLYTVDVDLGRIVHVKRIVRAVTAEEFARTGRTGIEVIDDRLDALDPRESTTVEDVCTYHGIPDVSVCINLATNFTTNAAAPTRERPYSLLSYKAVVEHGIASGAEHLFAYVNRGAIKSLGRLGVPSDLLQGREFHLPAHEGYDLDYVAIHLDASQDTIRVFHEFDPAHPLSRIVSGVSLPLVILLDDPAEGLDLTDAALEAAGEPPLDAPTP